MKTLIMIFFSLSLQTVLGQELDEHYFKASVSIEGAVNDNEIIHFRIVQNIQLKDVIIPKGTFFSAVAKFTEDRVLFEIQKIKSGDKIYAANFAIVAPDLKEGIPRIRKKNWIRLYSGEYMFLIKD